MTQNKKAPLDKPDLPPKVEGMSPETRASIKRITGIEINQPKGDLLARAARGITERDAARKGIPS